MRECDNSKIHISSNSLLSVCLLIMLDTLLLVPSLYCNTLLHLTKLHFFFICHSLYTTRISPVGILRDIYSKFFFFYKCVLYIVYQNLYSYYKLYAGSVGWLQSLVSFRLFLQHVVNVVDQSGYFCCVYVVLYYLGEGEFLQHCWSFFGEQAAVCQEM